MWRGLFGSRHLVSICIREQSRLATNQHVRRVRKICWKPEFSDNWFCEPIRGLVFLVFLGISLNLVFLECIRYDLKYFLHVLHTVRPTCCVNLRCKLRQWWVFLRVCCSVNISEMRLWDTCQEFCLRVSNREEQSPNCNWQVKEKIPL